MGKQYTTYSDTLEVCNLDSLHTRREQLSLKIFKSLMNSEQFSSWIPHLEVVSTRETYVILTNFQFQGAIQLVIKTAQWCI